MASISGQRWSILSTHRLIGSAKVYGVEAGSAPYDSVPHVFYWDLAARHDFGSFALLAGVSNLLDRAPPFFFDGKTNSNPNTYDYIGRFIFARLSYQR